MESTGGGLWLRSDNDDLHSICVSSNLGERLPEEPVTSPFVDWLTRQKTVIELAEAADSSRYPNLHLPDWLRTLTRAWLVVPLLHRDLLQGFLVLGNATHRTVIRLGGSRTFTGAWSSGRQLSCRRAISQRLAQTPNTFNGSAGASPLSGMI